MIPYLQNPHGLSDNNVKFNQKDTININLISYTYECNAASAKCNKINNSGCYSVLNLFEDAATPTNVRLIHSQKLYRND